MLRRVLAVLLLTVALTGCGDDDPAPTQREVSGDTVVKRIEAAMRKAGTGHARQHDGRVEYRWDLRKPGRLQLVSHETRVESRQIGDTVYQRAAGVDVWVRLPFDKPIQPVPELSYFADRQVTEFSKNGTVTHYVVEVPARLVEGRSEKPGEGDQLAVTIVVNADGLPLRTSVEGNGLAGESFSDWGDPVTIEKPAESVKGELPKGD